jgi:hypothetical protein
MLQNPAATARGLSFHDPQQRLQARVSQRCSASLDHLMLAGR